MKIFRVFLFVLSLVSYYFAPVEFNYLFIVWVFILFVLSGYLSIKEDIKDKFFFSFSVLYLLSFFLVSFAYPVFIYGTPLKLLYMEYVEPIYIVRGTALCQLAFSAYVLGMSFVKNKHTGKIAHLTNKVYIINYLTIPSIGFVSLIVGVILLEQKGGEVINYDVGWSATLYLLCLIYPTILTFFSGKNGIYSKRIFLYTIIAITGFLLLFIIQDRGLFLNIVIIFLSAYTFWIRRFSFYKTFAVLIIGILALSIIGQSRGKSDGVLAILDSSGNNESASNWDNFNDLTSISRNIYEGYEYQEKFGYFHPERGFIIAVSPVPYLPQILQEIFFANNFDPSTSSVLSKYTISKTGLRDDGGLGTSAVIDLYMSWGVIGVIVMNALLGFFVRKSRIMMDGNIYYAVIYLVFTAFAIYIPRATIFEPYRLIIWMLILVFFLQNKTFSTRTSKLR